MRIPALRSTAEFPAMSKANTSFSQQPVSPLEYDHCALSSAFCTLSFRENALCRELFPLRDSFFREDTFPS